jgi:hypothetical protein
MQKNSQGFSPPMRCGHPWSIEARHVSENTKKVVLADTNVLLEAHRIGCLKALCAQHSIVTVRKCIEETQTGFHLRPPEGTISREFLQSSLLEIAEVSKLELATLELRLPSGPYLDDGEKHLLAYALTRSDSYSLCGPDRAMIRNRPVITH